mmetsp:Transcript_7870/g.15227  ORF Transcript_7870/g.15227 Transcript_7870/m.15227 type:complete len:525 (-) Transcript_7870:276-1850(-)
MSSKNTAIANSNNPSAAFQNPSVAAMQKYGLRALPEDFVPTAQEQVLLDMYETVRQYERQAKRLKEDAARRKLEASKEAFEQRNRPKNKRKRRPATTNPEDEDEEEQDASDAEMSVEEQEEPDDQEEDEEEKAQRRHEAREAKLHALRQEVEEKKQTKERKEELLRAEHLEGEDDALAGETLRKKVKKDVPAASSLIANLKAAATPPHDFSSSYELQRGEVLFPWEDMETDEYWSPPEEKKISHPTEGALELILDNFDLQAAEDGTGANTIAVKFKAPPDSKRFSINIGLADEHNDYDSILFHFNPRQRERGGQLVINDKSEGTWGQDIKIPLSQLPLIFGQSSSTLLIQINTEGFDVFIEKEHCARLEHRTPIPSGRTRLVLQMPSSDDYGNPERWTVFRVWWGIRPSMAKQDLSTVAGVNIYRAEHPRKLIIRNLPKIKTVSEVDIRRAEIERAFRKYGGDRGVMVIVPMHRTFAFVEMDTDRQADLALNEMGHIYQLGRARRSKHEALQEERAAKEKAGGD